MSNAYVASGTEQGFRKCVCLLSALVHRGMFSKERSVCYTRGHKEVFKCHVRIAFYFLKEINV